MDNELHKFVMLFGPVCLDQLLYVCTSVVCNSVMQCVCVYTATVWPAI